MSLQLEVERLVLDAMPARLPSLSDVVKQLKAQARKKSVRAVEAQLVVDDVFKVRLAVVDKGANIRVAEVDNRAYRLDENGLQNALADVIHRRGAPADALAAFEKILAA